MLDVGVWMFNMEFPYVVSYNLHHHTQQLGPIASAGMVSIILARAARLR